MSKIDAINSIYEEGKVLKEDQLEAFASSIGKLLGDTFLLERNKYDSTAYSVISRYYALADAYLEMMSVTLRKNQGIIYIETDMDGNRFHLLKLDTVILLCLRKIEFEMMRTASASLDHTTTLRKLKKTIVESEVYTETKLNASATKFMSALKILRHYKFIDYLTSEFDINNDDSLITIYPPVSLVVTAENIDNLNATLDAYVGNERQEESDDEDTNED